MPAARSCSTYPIIRPTTLPRNPVKSPDEEHVKLPAVCGGQDRGERRAITPGATHGIGISGDDLEPEPLRPLPQLALLVLGRLLLRAHADVEGAANHLGAAKSAAILLPLRGVIRGCFAVFRGDRSPSAQCGKRADIPQSSPGGPNGICHVVGHFLRLPLKGAALRT